MFGHIQYNMFGHIPQEVVDDIIVFTTMKATAKPNFADIARHLTEAIATGRFPVGSLLPTEFELCDKYKTSRHTIRAALHELQQSCLVSRRKNVGTRVESNRPVNAFRPALASLDDLMQFGSTHVRKVLTVRKVILRGSLARELRCENESKWLRISSVRMDGKDSPPVGWTDAYIDPAFADIAETVKSSPDTLISALIEERYGHRIAQIRQEIHAMAITEAMAKHLQVAPGTPALKIIRWYLDRTNRPFEISVSVHPAGRFAVSMQLERSSQ